MRLKLIFLTLCIAISQLGLAQEVTIETTVNHEKVSLDERLEVEFKIILKEVDITPDFTAPDFTSFTMMGNRPSIGKAWYMDANIRFFTHNYTYTEAQILV